MEWASSSGRTMVSVDEGANGKLDLRVTRDGHVVHFFNLNREYVDDFHGDYAVQAPPAPEPVAPPKPEPESIPTRGRGHGSRS